MYEMVVEATPKLIRPLTRTSSILKGIQEQGCREVTKRQLYVVAESVTPKKYVARTLRILDQTTQDSRLKRLDGTFDSSLSLRF
jgi:hypothetical protein